MGPLRPRGPAPGTDDRHAFSPSARRRAAVVQIVDIADKPSVERRARAEGFLHLAPGTVRAIRDGTVAKGDVVAVAEVAATTATKRTPDLLPLCHPVPLTSVRARIEVEDAGVRCRVEVGATYRTGVEMEALTGAAIGLLAVFDMVKAMEKDAAGGYPNARIEGLRVTHKEKADR